MNFSVILKFLQNVTNMFINGILSFLKSLHLNFLRFIDNIILKIPLFPVKLIHNKILVVRMDEIGDFVLWLEAARALRTIYPHGLYEITLVGNLLWMEIAKDLLPFDKFVGINKNRFKKNLLYRNLKLLSIRVNIYKIAINPHYSRQYYFDDSIIRTSRADRKVGFFGDFENITPSEKQKSDKWYTELIYSKSAELMELKRNAEFVRALGAAQFQATIPSLSLYKDIPKSDFFILFPGAGIQGKCWPPEFFSNLAQILHNETGYCCVVCGGSSEIGIAEIIIKNSSNTPIVNQTGKTTLKGLARLLSQAKFLVSNDTAAVHIAAAVGTQSFCLLGGGHFGRFLPYCVDKRKNTSIEPCVIFSPMPCFGCGWKCKYPVKPNEPFPCITNITIESAVKKILPKLIY